MLRNSLCEDNTFRKARIFFITCPFYENDWHQTEVIDKTSWYNLKNSRCCLACDQICNCSKATGGYYQHDYLTNMKKVNLLFALAIVLTAFVMTNCSKNEPFDPTSVVGISISTPPTKAAYYEGEDLDLSGMIVELQLNNSSTKKVSFKDFDGYDLTTEPENGTRLTKESSNTITIKQNDTGQTTAQNITFNTVTDIDGNVYRLVKIGDQVWMRENLKTTKFQNGDVIGTTNPATLDISGETEPEYEWAYNGDESNVDTYGRLYTQYVAMDSRNVCPEGFRVPQGRDFSTLISYLQSNGYNYDKSTDANKLGKAIAAKTNWDSYTYLEGPGNNPETNNSSGFTGLPSGDRINSDKIFLGMGGLTYWWTVDVRNGAGVGFRVQNVSEEAEIIFDGDVNSAAPIRCIKE